MAQFPLLWIERRSYSSFTRIQTLCFDADYDKWLEDYSRVVMELHEQRHAILPVEFGGQEFEAYCKQNGIPADPDSLARYTRFRASRFVDLPRPLVGGRSR